MYFRLSSAVLSVDRQVGPDQVRDHPDLRGLHQIQRLPGATTPVEPAGDRVRVQPPAVLVPRELVVITVVAGAERILAQARRTEIEPSAT